MHHPNFVLNAAKALTTLIFTAMLMAFYATPAAANPANSGIVEQQILEFHNAERAARGIRPLASDGRLQQKAREWAQRLAREGTIYHMDVLPARSFGFRAGGENIIYRAPSMTSNYAHIEWMLSDLHRKNLLDPAFSHAGIGVTCATVGDRNFTVAVVEFGADSSPSTSVPPLDPRVVGGDPYAGTEVTCKGFAPLDLSPILSIVLPPATQSGIAPTTDPAPAPVVAKPKPKPVPVPVPVAPPAPVPAPPAPAVPAVVAPTVPAPEVEAPLETTPVAEPEKRPTMSTTRQMEPSRAAADRTYAAIWSGAFFVVALCAWLVSGVLFRRNRRAKPAAAGPASPAAVIAPRRVSPNGYSGRTSLLDLTCTPSARGNIWISKK